ncbi:citrate synthase [Caldalkalibacillus uzonensis]|uniref:Citrate synthase n=1 Tax=Caldalkalibacillus uzonensis TaxID=353224 RepID=A0ABU0CNV6_9BACI|nr:citrate/2-methylcitrate synthase [Caldalkalibacillus uzonensis]MDQ0338098.1 citrate synthase [Caldalkalibacillus uzonensis]
MSKTNFAAGLEDVIAGTSGICFIDGKEGKLIYSGYSVEDLVKHDASFEEVVYLLHHQQLPTLEQLNAFKQALVEELSLSNNMIELMRSFVPHVSPMVALRSAVSLLQTEDRPVREMDQEDLRSIALRLVAKMPSLVAAIHRIREGQDVLQPDKKLSLAANFLYMLSGQVPEPLEEKTMNIALILHADHEFNASTFAARVTAATESDLYSAVTSAIGTLKGPLHGGANEAVMKLLFEIGDVDNVEAVIQRKLENKVKISGFGHRVYKTMDPRASILKRMSKEIGEKKGNTKWYELTEAVERVVFEKKGLYPNVDLYSASTYYVLGIKMDLFTPIFAVSRIGGWTAHILEQYANNRLIRPLSVYTGHQRREYVPPEQR